jgi:GNAT superfamily N-acetyltransferase
VPSNEDKIALAPTEFNAAGLRAIRLSIDAASMLQRLVERCADYYELAEGRAATPDTAIEELTAGPPERVPHDLVCLGLVAKPESLAGMIGALRNHRRPNQWYLGLMLLDPAFRGRGVGRACYRAFEDWIIAQGAESILLAVVEPNVRAASFWQSVGFGWPRCYPERTIGLRRHVLIEYEKSFV